MNTEASAANEPRSAQVAMAAAELLRDNFANPAAGAGRSPMVDVVRIAQNEGVAIQIRPREDENAVLCVVSARPPAIHIFNDEPFPMQRFAIARGLAALKLGGIPEAEELVLRHSALGRPPADALEADTNWFAACLLMPDETLAPYRRNQTPLASLATLFAVPEEVAAYRMSNDTSDRVRGRQRGLGRIVKAFGIGEPVAPLAFMEADLIPPRPDRHAAPADGGTLRRSTKLAQEASAAEAERQAQANTLRDRWSATLVFALWFELAFQLLLFIGLVAFPKRLIPFDKVLIALIVQTFAQVVGLCLVIVRYLFPGGAKGK
ncbi:MAG: ImmA/IrrE family metallo-endopeptidase [Armatimonadetes bacterium]|nr:ImmA/IrrE family metallo-endopeptidase [Armatimonadota bacterium]MDE2207705.1 ImmA/IrrE family metallo-endopeptidase [Armatimonadota bacterium]